MSKFDIKDRVRFIDTTSLRYNTYCDGEYVVKFTDYEGVFVVDVEKDDEAIYGEHYFYDKNIELSSAICYDRFKLDDNLFEVE